MSDYYIKHFYNQVKDSSWPNIDTYNDFLNMSAAIKEECLTQHNLQTRLTQLEDKNYWGNHQAHNVGYQYKNIVYVPVRKCANTYYVNFFKNQLNWKKVNLTELNWNEVEAFGLMMNPMTRRVKGITETLCMAYNYNYTDILRLFSSPEFSKFVSYILLTDAHTIPYNLSFGPALDKIHWIPMEPFTDTELKNQIAYFLNTKNISVTIPADKRINQSSPEKELIFDTLKNISLSNEPPAELGLLFAQDVKFYNNLLKTYAPLYNHNT